MKNNYQQFYHCISAPFRHHSAALKLLRGVNLFVVWIMYFVYIGLLLWVIKTHPSILWKVVLIPGIGFIILSVVRQRINAPRPYEKFAIKPLIFRDKTGDSMPSRHVFSATVIAMCGLYFSISWGIILLLLAVVSAITRVIGGVHFPRDVFVGFICGLICGLFLFLV
ncbi:phosphatase PAP2 family protein [Limosilactobacillus sp. STM2_1]|uniref:Phosphatase PAP2 family protein n=1 Tax=Limosilactobacillus rudii TaxID=2759755 RepID=A0A7W3UMX0_9LACO|nr:phosphatase PAP2 family protein [Limosilactobacillus rudii]MBB1079288.1 phosphatase PAP2 family protein [Limosilactobacillus rudii]MBB1098518.1 phosphatase PAP2 family protein [Limosilactobacillus rudii]MCD7135527.1 phosphatase PAP2 family protein [Limosilactobacillus rudii]